jgi:hypothetical protein
MRQRKLEQPNIAERMLKTRLQRAKTTFTHNAAAAGKARPVPRTPWTRLRRSTGVTPCKGVGGHTKWASLGVCIYLDWPWYFRTR